MYYLQSRYYDPAIGRFNNADTFATTDANSFLSCNMFAYCENDPVNRSDENGECLHVVVGAAIGGLFELGSQLLATGGRLSEVNWGKVGVATAVGAITSACGPWAGAAISGVGNAMMEAMNTNTNWGKVGCSFLIGAGSSLLGSGAGLLGKKLAGKVAVKQLAKKGPGQIKAIINDVIHIAGRDRNKVKNVAWTLAQDAYRNLPDALVGKTVPQAINSITTGLSGYGSMGAIYGFK